MGRHDNDDAELAEIERLAYQRDHAETSAERIDAANALLDMAEREGLLDD